MTMNLISQLPAKKGVIGTREIAKAISTGKVNHVVIANNCPDFLLSKIQNEKVLMERFDGNQKQLGTKLGKPFAVAMVGY